MIAALKKFLGIRTEAESFRAGAEYVSTEVAKFGAANTEEMNRLWAECDGAIDNSAFDKGMVRELIRLNIPDPQDPRWCH